MNIENLQKNIENLRNNEERNVIEQVKYVSSIQEILSDSFAQICNDFREAHVLAVNLVFDNSTLIEINYSTKFKWKSHNEQIQTIVSYLFCTEYTKRFIILNTKEKFLNFFKINQQHYDALLYYNLKTSIINNDNDKYVLNNVCKLLICTTKEIIQIFKESNQFFEFYHLIILFLNYLVLRDIFTRNYKKSNSLKINQYVDIAGKKKDKKVHPDSKLALAINHPFTRKYIGVSHLCCIYCTMFLDCHSIDFRGRSKQYEKWMIPIEVREKDSQDIVTANLNRFSIMYNENRIGIQNATEQEPFSFNYNPIKQKDNFQDASHFISDDASHFLMYYVGNDFQEFYFVLEEYNNRDRIIELIQNLKYKLM